MSTISSVAPEPWSGYYGQIMGGVSNQSDGCLKNNSTECSSSTRTSGAESFGRDEDLAKVEVLLQAIIFFLAVCGNSIVLLILLGLQRRKKRLSRMNRMIVHLSLADLFVAFFNVLPQLAWDATYRFVGNDYLCRSVKYCQVVAMYASSYVLVSTAIDRFLAICHPLSSHTWTQAKTHALVAVAWLLSLLFSVPQLFIFSYREVEPGSGVYDCWGEFVHPEWSIHAYITWVTVAIYIVPFILLSVAYGRICCVVFASMLAKESSVKEKSSSRFGWKSPQSKNDTTSMSTNGEVQAKRNSSQMDTHHNRPRAHVQGLSNAKVKTVKLTLVVILCYLVCWGPFFLSQMWAAWDPDAPLTGSAFAIMMLLASLNSCANPWIYLAFSPNLFRQVAQCFRGRRLLDGTSASGFESDSRMRSTLRSTTEVTRLDSHNIPLNAYRG